MGKYLLNGVRKRRLKEHIVVQIFCNSFHTPLLRVLSQQEVMILLYTIHNVNICSLIIHIWGKMCIENVFIKQNILTRNLS